MPYPRNPFPVALETLHLQAQPRHTLPAAALDRMPVNGQKSPSVSPLTCCSVCS